MTDTATTDVATTFVETLTARGVTLKAHGKKGLAMVPKSAYTAMSNEERATLKAHKRDIIAVVREGKYATASIEPTAARVEPPAPCAYCYQVPCVGLAHPLFAVLHSLDPEEIARRTQEANEDAVDQQIAYQQMWPTARMREKFEARQPKMTEKEERQAALRRAL